MINIVVATPKTVGNITVKHEELLSEGLASPSFEIISFCILVLFKSSLQIKSIANTFVNFLSQSDVNCKTIVTVMNFE